MSAYPAPWSVSAVIVRRLSTRDTMVWAVRLVGRRSGRMCLAPRGRLPVGDHEAMT
ncbi:hypothetical protein [Kibdelosporangium philippinense]|uniref:hypothetical protein n=1 Tax=Kibdelosporangium philippinense TaxID=211113 RepID=UPI003609344A